MKRIILVFLILISAGITGAFAQEIKNESEYYPVTLSIAKIYTSPQGYRIDYIRQDYSLGTLWAPLEWFRDSASTGEIAYGKGRAYPYVTFFYKDGQVDHFRLYLLPNPADETWGVLDKDTDYSDKFPSPDSKPEISY